MRHFSICVMLFFSMTGFSENEKKLKCRAADENNAHRKEVTVTTVVGSQLIDPKVTEYGDYKLTVIFNKGSEFESQTSLFMTTGEIASKVYNVSDVGLYQLIAPGLFLQCWFE